MAKIDKLQLKRGLETNIPVLNEAEPGFTTNTKKLFIGSSTGNVEIANQESLNTHSEDYLSHFDKEKVVRSNKDTFAIFTTVEKYRADNTLYYRSTLSDGTAPNYTTRVATIFDTDGITVLDSVTYTLTYDIDGDFLTETPV